MAQTYETIVRIKLNHPEAKPPQKMTSGAAGYDIFSCIDESMTILPGERAIIPTGFSMELENGFEAMIRPRSGLAARDGVTLLNSPGTIDSDYRGEVKLIMINLGQKPFEIKNGHRLAQMVINRIPVCIIEISEILSTTDRDSGGFGSTGQ